MTEPKKIIKQLFGKCEIDFVSNGVVFDVYFESLDMAISFYKDEKDIKKEEEVIKELSKIVYAKNVCYKSVDYCERFVKVIHIKEDEFHRGLKELLLFMDNNAIFSLSDHM